MRCGNSGWLVARLLSRFSQPAHCRPGWVGPHPAL